MEVSLRKPQRIVFEIVKKHPGSFFRKYRKSGTATRLYYRLMTSDFNPIRNFNEGVIRPLFDKDILIPTDFTTGYRIKDDVVLMEKKKK